MKTLYLPVRKRWFDMILSGEKKEEYREINEYWIKRLIQNELNLSLEEINYGICALRDGYTEDQVYNIYGFCFKPFEINTITLGYPKSTDKERIIKFEHKGIEIGKGNPEWGAPVEDVFIIKLGEIIEAKNID